MIDELISLLEEYLTTVEKDYPLSDPPSLSGLLQWLKEKKQ